MVEKTNGRPPKGTKMVREGGTTSSNVEITGRGGGKPHIGPIETFEYALIPALPKEWHK